MEYTQESNLYRLELKRLSEVLLMLAIQDSICDWHHDEILHDVLTQIANMKKAIAMFIETDDVEFADSYLRG